MQIVGFIGDFVFQVRAPAPYRVSKRDGLWSVHAYYGRRDLGFYLPVYMYGFSTWEDAFDAACLEAYRESIRGHR